MQYYYFIAGLPGISIEDSKLSYEPSVFREDAKKHLNDKDYRLLELLHLPDELEIILSLIYERPAPDNTQSVYPEDWWPQYLSLKREELSNPMLRMPKSYASLPDFIGRYLGNLLQKEELPDYYEADVELLNLAYEYLESVPNAFIKAWFELDQQIRNIVMAINGREHGYEYSSFLVGKSEIVDKLARASGSDFGLGKSSELFESIWRIYEQNNILYREKGYDLLRWKWIDSTNFFQYFTIDRILGYYSKLRILSRWVGLDTDSGKDSFYDSLTGLEHGFELPHEYSLKALRGGSSGESEQSNDNE